MLAVWLALGGCLQEVYRGAVYDDSYPFLLGLLLGVAWGLFFGEHGSWVKWIGDAFVGLLQMTILPYVAVSLTSNIGRLSARECGRMARVALGVMLLLWAIGLVTLVLAAQCFPKWDGGSFFSSSMVQEPAQANWLELFIPSNPFFSLTNNLVPAVVLFSVGLGVALIPVANKFVLIEKLDVLTTALGRLNAMIVQIAPLGMFGVAGYTAGTMSLEQFGLLQGYLLVFCGASLLLTFWVLPALIACCTPFSHREVLAETRDVLITAFALGNTFVVLPMIGDAVQRLLRKRAALDMGSAPPAEEAVPLAYPFPDVGRIVTIVFIPFAAWFYGSQIDPASVPQLVGTGLLSSFAKPVVSIPLLLSLAELPADIFNLFLAVGVVASRFGDLMKTMHLITFSILTSCILAGVVRLNLRRIAIRTGVTAALVIVSVVAVQEFLERNFENAYDRGHLIVARELLGEPGESVVLESSAPSPQPLETGEDRMQRVLRRGVVRIGVDPRRLPIAYYNANDDLVGYDIDMAHQLARDLGVKIEFVPFEPSELAANLKADYFDVGMSALEVTVERASELPEMHPYMEMTGAFVTPDHRRSEVNSLADLARSLRGGPPLRLGVLTGGLAAETRQTDTVLGGGWGALKKYGVAQHIDRVDLDSPADFFEQSPPAADVFVTSAEEGAAWTLKHPEYTVVTPEGFDAKSPLCYFVAERSQFRDFINSWLDLKRRNGTTDALYNYWVLGKQHADPPPRWCVLRDVLHWVE